MAELLIDVGETVTLADALLVLGEMLSWLVVVALCGIIVAFVYSILWPLNKLVSGLTGGIVGSVPGSHAVESAVTTALASSVASLDKKAGKFFHALKHLVETVGEEVFGLAVLGAYLAWYVSPEHLATLIAQHIGGFVRSVGKAEQLARTAKDDAIKAQKYAQSEAAHLDHRINALSHTVEGVLQPEITTTRDLAKAAEAEATKVWNLIKTQPWAVGATAFAGAVAVALTSLGLGWLKCDSNPFNNNKNACGLWGTLSKLLGLAAFLTVAFDFQEFVDASDEVAKFIGKSVGELETISLLSIPPLPPPQ